jgi:formyltetrahydrofolate deformylase
MKAPITPKTVSPQSNPRTAVLLLQCPERIGVVAAVANFIYSQNGSIVHADEHKDPELGLFMMRVEWSLDDFKLPLEHFAHHFEPVAKQFGMWWRIAESSYRPKVAIFVSKSGHCLADLLYRHHIGELPCEIPLVLSNHDDQRALVEFYKIPFVHLPFVKDQREAIEQEQFRLLAEHKIELIVLARYMQILSNEFITRYPNRVINIHHSFLPAFIGAKPYHRSYERGVKLVGATSHYVTEVLDEGPIIEQDIVRISHRDTLDEMIRKGSDVERLVLSRAVLWHLENRVIVYGDGKKTAVFA